MRPLEFHDDDAIAHAMPILGTDAIRSDARAIGFDGPIDR